jgi:hypothetical protein
MKTYVDPVTPYLELVYYEQGDLVPTFTKETYGAALKLTFN